MMCATQPTRSQSALIHFLSSFLQLLSLCSRCPAAGCCLLLFVLVWTCSPVWFVYMLWWFSVAYMLIASCMATSVATSFAHWLSTHTSSSCCKHKDAAAGTSQGQPGTASQQYSLGWMLWTGGWLILALTAVSFAARAAALGHLQPAKFLQYSFWVVLMPDYLGKYVISFTLGVLASHHNTLARLPSSCGWWCLAAASLWYTEALFVFSWMALPPLSVSSLGLWAYATFAEQASEAARGGSSQPVYD